MDHRAGKDANESVKQIGLLAELGVGATLVLTGAGVATKRAAGRPRDLEAIAELEALRQEIGEARE